MKPRHRLALATTGVVATALLLGTALSVWQAVRATPGRTDRAGGQAGRRAGQAAAAVSERPGSRPAAEAAHEQLRRTLYAAEMGLVQAAWEGGRLDEALRRLDQEKADNPDLRGFEWYYWMRQAHQDVRRPPHPGCDEPPLLQHRRRALRHSTFPALQRRR